MSFDYEQMKQDIIDHWKVDMSISWKSDIVNIAKVRHRATLLGFRYDNMNLQKEIKKFEEAAKLFHRAYILYLFFRIISTWLNDLFVFALQKKPNIARAANNNN